jgi:predicted TIM-barrel fold metal-dependent hydrolase
MSKILMISSDCHAGALPGTYVEYLPKQYQEAGRRWWVNFVREMMNRAGTFFDQEALDDYTEKGGRRGLMDPEHKKRGSKLSDDDLMALLADETSPFAPRRGEFDASQRVQDLDGDGVAGEVVFGVMVTFGGGLMQYRDKISPDENLEGIRAYNRWLADFCKTNPGRHAGVALINVDDIGVSVKEIREAKEMGLWGGILLPTSTGEHPFYHDARYEPLWAVCEELDMPIHSHSGWSPDYGDGPAATPMYITEVDMWPRRAFPALMWAGVFDRYPNLKLVFTEAGCGWIVEALRLIEFKAANPIFKYFTTDLKLTPREYFARNCHIGASFMPVVEGELRHKVGVDRLMYGTDYPHLEGTWPNTLPKLQETFSEYPEQEIRDILGENAMKVYAFDRDLMNDINDRVGLELSQIRGEA